MKYAVCVAWHNPDQKKMFLTAWGLRDSTPDFLILQHDKNKEGCAKTKNKGIERALEMGADVVIVLDDDCYPELMGGMESVWDLEQHAKQHLGALEPQPVELYEAITDPPSRGTPYFNRTVTMPVAASMGYWEVNPDWDAVGQLTHNPKRFVEYKRKAMYGKFFPFSGMNCAFRSEFWPFFKFDETADRFDDIFMGYRLQAEAYRRGYCINLNGPTVRHVRQSNIWKNLQVEAENMERNETEWQQYVPKPT